MMQIAQSTAMIYKTRNMPLRKLWVSEQEVNDVLQIVAGLLAFGNISFAEAENSDAPSSKLNEENETCRRAVSDTIKLFGWGSNSDDGDNDGDDDESNDFGSKTESVMLGLVLCKRTTSGGRRASIQEILLSPHQAMQSRDGLAKFIYSSLFQWLFNRFNAMNSSSSQGGSKDGDALSIGILDIFGFEILSENAFPQLCINYANESLQKMYNDQIFQLERQYYEEEGIPMAAIEFFDNQPLLKLIDGLFITMNEMGMLSTNTPSD